MKKLFFFITLLLFIAILNGACTFANSFEDYQKDADIIRLRHLKYYSNLLVEYYKKAGKYPFQGEHNLPVYVYVAHAEQIASTKSPLPFSNISVSFKDFIHEIENTLGRTVNEYYDPQNQPYKRPNFYTYMVNGEYAYFAIHTHNKFPFSRKISDNYYKIEVSNKPTKENKAHSIEGLVNSDEFLKFSSTNVKKESYFKKLENKNIHYTKTITE